MSDDLSESMNIFKGNRRYEYKPQDPRVLKAEQYLESVVEDMKAGTWQHYPIPAPRKVGRPKKSIVPPVDADGVEEDEVDQDYDDKDDIDAVLLESVEEGARKKKKSKPKQKRWHQAETKAKMQTMLTLQ